MDARNPEKRIKMDNSDIDFSRGDEDIVFIQTEVDSSDFPEDVDPRKKLLERVEEKGLEIEDGQIIGIFKDEFSVLLQEDTKITLNGEKIHPKDND